MNCQEFERVIIELASGGLMDAEWRQNAQTHASACARCAARLEQERTLSARLSAVAAAEARINAPDHIRQSLRAAFDTGIAPASAPAPAFSAQNHRWWWGWAAAAALLLAVTTVLWRGVRSSGWDLNADQTPGASATPTPRPAEKQPEIKQQENVAPVARNDLASAPAPKRRVIRRQREIIPAVEFDDGGAEFFPLTLVAQTEVEGAQQIVRVEVPRSTLLMWGLPVNAERAGEMVQADVVIGEYGVARAIRILN
ncbi:MAG: hypothetical protein ACREBD_01085 [Blastocatellia bacterium]